MNSINKVAKKSGQGWLSRLFNPKFTYGNKEKNTKQQVLEWVTSDNSEIKWPTKILKSGPNKGQLRICNEAYDMADAYVIGKSFLVENS